MRIKKFNELFHGTGSSSIGQVGSDLANGVFRKIGKMMGMEIDVLEDYLQSLLNDREIDKGLASEIRNELEFKIKGKSKKDIYRMVDSYITENS